MVFGSIFVSVEMEIEDVAFSANDDKARTSHHIIQLTCSLPITYASNYRYLVLFASS